MLPSLLVAGAVAGVALGAPMVSGAVTSFSEPVALESTSASAGTDAGGSASSDGWGSSEGSGSAGAAGSGVVQMGIDGAPASGTAAEAPAQGESEAPAPGSPEAPLTPEQTAAATGGDEPAATDAPAPSSSSSATAPPRPRSADSPAPAPAPAPAPTARAAAAAPADPTAEGQVLALVNEQRAAAGCAPVVADAGLAAVARAHSADMRDRDFFSHTNPEGLSPFDRAERAGISYSRAENIAYGQRDASAVMEAWMNSSGHRANILDCGLTKLGVGIADGSGGPWYTQLFGS